MELTITRHSADHPDLAHYTVATPDGRTLYQSPDPIDAATWAASQHPDQIRLRWDEYTALCDPSSAVLCVELLLDVTHLPRQRATGQQPADTPPDQTQLTTDRPTAETEDDGPYTSWLYCHLTYRE